MKKFSPLLALSLSATLVLNACAVFDDNKVDYRSAQKGQNLEVPPDLTALSHNDRYAVRSDGSVSATGYENAAQLSKTLPVAATEVADIRIERDGQQRWLVVNRPATVLWPQVTGFWKDNGFTLASQDQALGIMETEWAENRAKLPQDFIRETLGKLLDAVYSTGERDKFRTRLEAQGDKTEIYITHRGMAEQLTKQARGSTVDTTVWQARAADPELEAEFLRRLMLKLGVSEQQAKEAIAEAQTPAAPTAKIEGQALLMSQDFDSAWRRVGLALDRNSFTVTDRDRSQGVYFVRYLPNTAQEEAGFFGRLMGKGKKDNTPEAAQDYRVLVASQAQGSQVSVQTAQQQSNEHTQKILQLLADELK